LDVQDTEKCREVWKACLDIIPHKQFTFAFVWLLFAKFELRQLNLNGTRKILGTAIGKCPKKKLFREYIEIELQLREFDRLVSCFLQSLGNRHF
jgi:crooked neck